MDGGNPGWLVVTHNSFTNPEGILLQSRAFADFTDNQGAVRKAAQQQHGYLLSVQHRP